MKDKFIPVLGCDPEVFVLDKNTGKHVPAHGLINGTKNEPLKVEHGMVQVDGLALEFGIDPAASKKEFIDRIKSVMKTLQGMLPKHLELDVRSVVTFESELLKGLPEEALELGCDPDYNGYTGLKNPRPKLPNPSMRSAGGHVHIGWDTGLDRLHSKHLLACSALAVELDYYLCVPSLSWDSDDLRRKIYGSPGAFRPKSYGMEYRSLSNQWLMSEELMSFVYDNTILAVNRVINDPKSTKPLNFFDGAISLTAKDIVEGNWGYLGKAVYKNFKDANV